ncbi:nucleotidyltransferase [Campylobacter sp.]|uniref:nucleotidyltransferase n=1 Tax=Campylobacter sp. TaxID=205 RepID=UPI0026DDB2F2|nr:nucleotidyltransferase [Campylobacter sp.]MDO4674040.1 nucleotidyltransferase [Campylobacter sp.]
MFEETQALKDEIIAYRGHCQRFFLKQGSFSQHHCKKVDGWVERAYVAVLRAYFGDFLPPPQLVPFCVIARSYYAKNGLCFEETLPLILVYKNLKIYQLKMMIKSFIGVLNDVGLRLDHVILELDGLDGLRDSPLISSLIQTRFICGSKPLFKESKEKFERLLRTHKDSLARGLFSPHAYPVFTPQEFDLKKQCGGLLDLRRLDDLLALFKNSPRNHALNFIDEGELSRLRLAGEFVLSFKSALNLQSRKDEDRFSLSVAEEMADLMYKKGKKNSKAAALLVGKILQSMHTISFYSIFLSEKIKNGSSAQEPKFSSLIEALQVLSSLDDVPQNFSIHWVHALQILPFERTKSEEALRIFEGFFERKHSFALLKLLLDSGKLALIFRPLQRFLCHEEGEYSFDVEAFLLLRGFEDSSWELCEEEEKLLKLVLLFHALGEERGGAFRAFCSRWDLRAQNLELGVRLCRHFNALKDLIEKEDIYNPIIITGLLSRLEDVRSLELLHLLTGLRARIFGMGDFFCRVLNRLLENAKEGFSDVNLLEEGTRRLKKEWALKRSGIFLKQDEILRDKILHIKSNLFVIKNSPEDIVKIAILARENPLKFWLSTRTNLSLEIIASKNFKPEFILNALTRFNLIFMSFYELFDDKIYLKFEYANRVDESEESKLYALLNSTLTNPIKKKIKKPSIKKDELKLDLNYSKFYAKLNLNARDQQGLMAFIVNTFSLYDLHLSTAKIQTIRQRTRNVFIFHKNDALLNHQERLINTLIGG